MHVVEVSEKGNEFGTNLKICMWLKFQKRGMNLVQVDNMHVVQVAEKGNEFGTNLKICLWFKFQKGEWIRYKFEIRHVAQQVSEKENDFGASFKNARGTSFRKRGMHLVYFWKYSPSFRKAEWIWYKFEKMHVVQVSEKGMNVTFRLRMWFKFQKGEWIRHKLEDMPVVQISGQGNAFVQIWEYACGSSFRRGMNLVQMRICMWF